MSGKIRLFWLILAVLFAAAAGFACFYADLFGSIYNRPDGDPGETVSQFFVSVRNGNYISAYSCLSDYLTIGKNSPNRQRQNNCMQHSGRATDIPWTGPAVSAAGGQHSGYSFMR